MKRRAGGGESRSRARAPRARQTAVARGVRVSILPREAVRSEHRMLGAKNAFPLIQSVPVRGPFRSSAPARAPASAHPASPCASAGAALLEHHPKRKGNKNKSQQAGAHVVESPARPENVTYRARYPRNAYIHRQYDDR